MFKKLGSTSAALAAIAAFGLGGSAIAGAATDDSAGGSQGSSGEAAQSRADRPSEAPAQGSDQQGGAPGDGDCPERDAS